MAKALLKKGKWTLIFDRRLKSAVVREAGRRGVYPTQVLESLLKEKFDPFGHTNIKDEPAYVRRSRRKDRNGSDEEFLEDIRRWEKINS